ncbi:MAG: radical SAM protein [Oscillospiraceae bacterium]|nr:radical SAM protein [Oscillospiraceae bacterium]
MKHSNVSVFIPHIGCPNMCSFCNQRTISGTQSAPGTDYVTAVCAQAAQQIEDKENAEIAFFGGSFTAIDPEYMISLLECVQKYTGPQGFRGIRVSTRPDCISEKILDILERYHVTAIELGCQSMVEDVLSKNERGHNVSCIRESSALIKSRGFELGAQMMTGLYGSSPQKDLYTCDEIIKLGPDTVRIYPVVVLEHTRLAQLYREGSYEIYPLEDMVKLCSEIYDRFTNSGIKIIKCGLHASEMVESDAVAGYYHPAFRELVESYSFRTNLEKHITQKGNYEVYVANRFISCAVGQKHSNTEYFSAKGINIRFRQDDSLSEREFIIKDSQKEVVDVFKIT